MRRLKRGLLHRICGSEGREAGVLGVAVEEEDRLAVEPIGGPVGRDVGAVAPDRADLLPTDRLPHPLAIHDVGAGEQSGPVAVDHPLGHRWLALVDRRSHPQQHRE
ncbi:MAG: hypothetical protein V9F04_03175 [Dermatophilaceae bacterium]